MHAEDKKREAPKSLREHMIDADNKLLREERDIAIAAYQKRDVENARLKVELKERADVFHAFGDMKTFCLGGLCMDCEDCEQCENSYLSSLDEVPF
ncbi:MAG: hypothetical protein GY696_29175 [Gammaproteobacteria bacterium]|nr:hypothetical protein [Gammaproteobacteria bacterium]